MRALFANSLTMLRQGNLVALRGLVAIEPRVAMVRREIADSSMRRTPNAKSKAKAKAKSKAKARAKATALPPAAMTPTARYPPKKKFRLAVYASKIRKSPASFLDLGSGKLVNWEVDDEDILTSMVPTDIVDQRRQFIVVCLRVQDPESYLAQHGASFSDIEDNDEVDGVVVEYLGVECYITGEQLHEFMQ